MITEQYLLQPPTTIATVDELRVAKVGPVNYTIRYEYPGSSGVSMQAIKFNNAADGQHVNGITEKSLLEVLKDRYEGNENALIYINALLEMV